METKLENENILNVTLIEPRLKHSTIFERFDELISGESLVLHNDHDPKPLYYELSAKRGDIFTWEYLQPGPEVWKVKITKKKETSKKEESILNATLLHPAIKHATIFNRFDALKPGESFILQNDHDPRPLRFQLENIHGNVFGWEYLEQGPEIFKIKISKNKPAAKEEKKESSNENILNVTAIEPKLKHPTIFVKFDELKAGESLTIHNDHDPKPLYYQLLGERGNVFTWEYLEQGPTLWRVKISKRPEGTADETLGEIAAKDLRKAEVFKKYGLDFCCGGKKTVKEACAEKGIDVTKVEQELQNSDKTSFAARPLPYNDWNLDFLADYIVNTHHSYVKKTIPDIKAYAEKVAKVHGAHHPELLQINKLAQEVCDEMSAHMVKEETVLFPYVKQLVASKNSGNGKVKFGNLDSVETPINLMEMEHEVVGNNMDEIRKISNNYALPEDACASYSFLFKTLDEFENDLHIHVHLENNILFPKAVNLEKN
ncbi:MAG TPA: iron-sulfur cluster repair di-iron protein [Hanamia sp.]|nr:iron-sulfur cluster repair di-iron protein [Hanamia sp.]